jgi:hypothetical protein
MRRALLFIVALALGCGASGRAGTSALPTESGAPDAPEMSDAADEQDAPAEQDAADASIAAPLAWGPSAANLTNGDVVSIWGTSGANFYVGTDMEEVDWVNDLATTSTILPSLVVGGGWTGDPSSVFAVGASAWLDQGGISSMGGLFRFTDSTWTLVTGGTFYSVWGSSAADLYLAGTGGVGHSIDGAAFVTESDASALSVWGNGPGDVYAATADPARTLLHRSSDGAWLPVYANPAGRAWAVWSSGPGDVYAVVSPIATGDPDACVAHSSNGDGGWTRESVDQPGARLVALWGSGPHDVYAAGWHASATGRSGDLFHSTGDGQWSRVDLPGAIYDVTCVWGVSAGEVYVGVYDVNAGPLLLRGQR